VSERWRIAKDEEADAFLDAICAELQSRFNISILEARARIEQGWKHLQDSEMGGPKEIAYHELPEYWASNFYYGKNSYWWLTGAIREQHKLPPLGPIPVHMGT
jgi:hypothetical protein